MNVISLSPYDLSMAALLVLLLALLSIVLRLGLASRIVKRL